MPKPSCRWCGLIVGSRRSFHIHHLHHSGQLRRPCLLFICQHEPRKGHPCQKAYESKQDVLRHLKDEHKEVYPENRRIDLLPVHKFPPPSAAAVANYEKFIEKGYQLEVKPGEDPHRPA